MLFSLLLGLLLILLIWLAIWLAIMFAIVSALFRLLNGHMICTVLASLRTVHTTFLLGRKRLGLYFSWFATGRGE